MKNLNISELNILKEKVINSLNSENLNEAKLILDSFPIKSESYYTLSANYYFLSQNYIECVKVLEKGLESYPYSFEIYFNLATIKNVMGDVGEALIFYAKCVRIASTEEDRSEANIQLTNLVEIVKTDLSKDTALKILDQTSEVLSEGDERTYPISRYNKSLVKEVLQDSQGNKYLIDMYKSMSINNVDKNSRYFFKTELLKGNHTNSISFNFDEKTTIPLAMFENSEDIKICGPDRSYTYPKHVLNSNQYNYLTFNVPGKYKISSPAPFFIGDPINMKPKLNSPQVILTIFVDGLSNSILEEDLSKLMPHTSRFFGDGYINNNCYTTGDWTFPSVASIYTGKTTLQHMQYHPNNHFDFNVNNHLFTKDFKKQGYLTGQINNNWRVTPTHGYIDGMDRILYQHYYGGFTAGEVVAETIEHLETFKFNNHFLWVGIEDLHDTADEINNDLYSQVHVSGEYRQVRNLGVTSVLSEYDINKVNKYESELKRIDLHLSSLYNYLEKNYNKDDIIVALISDHGQTYLQEDDFLLHEPKRKVPFMLVGRGVKSKVSTDLCSIMDLYPTIAKLADMEIDNQEGMVLKEFGGTGREFCLTETVHPNQPYLAAITDNDFIFRFKTRDYLTANGVVDLEYFDAVLLSKESLVNVSEQHKEKFNYYCNFVISRVIKLQK